MTQKPVRRITVLLVLISMTLAVMLSGCQTSAPTPQPTVAPTAAATTAPTAAPAATPTPVEISVIAQIPAEMVLDNNPVVAEIQKETGIKLDIQAPPLDSYGDAVKLAVSSGDTPDLFMYGADVYATQWANQGVLLNLTNLIPNYPNLSSNISAMQYGDCEFNGDGQIWGVPRPNTYDEWGFLINKTWLDKLGLQVPRTVADFENVCKAFTESDPDGDGKPDTYGACLDADSSAVDSGIWHLHNDFLSTAYYISDWHYALPDKDGSFHLRAFKGQYFDYLQELNKLYSDGYIERDFTTFSSQSANKDWESLAEQRVGIVGCSEKSYTTDVLEHYNLSLDDYEYCAPLVMNQGDKGVYAMPPSNWMAWYVSAKSTKADACLRYLDWGNSQDGFVLTQFGIAGQDYNSYDISNRTIDRTNDQVQAVAKVTSNMFSVANAYQGLPALQGGDTQAQITKWQTESAAAESATRKCYMPFFKICDQVAIQFPDDVQTLNTDEVRYVTGQMSLDDLKSFVNGEYKTKVGGIETQFEQYMAQNPVTWKD